MNDENSLGGTPVLDDIDYSDSQPRKQGPVGVAAPILDDIEYSSPAPKRGDPTGVTAPVLDDMENYVPPVSRRGAPTGVTAPVLDDEPYTPQGTPAAAAEPEQKSEKLILSDEDIINGLSPEQKQMFDNLPADKQQQIITMRRTQLGAEAPEPEITAPVLEENDYTPPPKKEEPPKPAEPVKAPVLDDEPEQKAYVPKYVDEDLERVKKEAAKKAVSSQLVSEQKDSKESLRMMLELKEEQRRESAKKGFKVTIVLAVLGVVAAVAFYILYSGGMGLAYKDTLSGFANFISESSMYIMIVMAVSGVGLTSGIGIFKSLASLSYLLSAIIQVFPGIVMISQHEGSKGLAIALYAVSIICTLCVFVPLSSNEDVGNYFSKK